MVAGPTGSGKSDLALRIAAEHGGEIVNCDSVQIYRHFDLGTAKLSLADRRGIPHHLIDIAEPHDVFTAGDYARLAREAIAGITARGRLPVVAGGTGFYLRALLEGLFAGPRRDAALRKRLAAREQRRPGSLHRLLKRYDAASAARIHANDTNKLMRALEVCLLSRRPLSSLWSEGRDRLEGHRLLRLALNPPRAELNARLDARCHRMFEQGLIEEARRILAMGYAPESKPFEALGYREAMQAIRGEIDNEEAIALAQRHTRQYAKRQWTWFRREPNLQWIGGFGGDPTVQEIVLRKVYEYLREFERLLQPQTEQNAS